MIILDTCVIIFDALTPKKLTHAAQNAIARAEEKNQLFCSDISLWEIAMLVKKKRLDPGIEIEAFLHHALRARGIQVLPITVEIAALSTASYYKHADPADRIIASTALYHNAALVTSDEKLRNIPELNIIW